MTPPGWPTDGLPRFKATDVNVLDRGDNHRIVQSWELVVPIDYVGPLHHPRAAELARGEADRLNALDTAGLPLAAVPTRPIVRR